MALTQTLEQRREQFHHSRLVEHVIPSGVQYQETLRRVTEYFTAHGSNVTDAKGQALAWIGSTIDQQAVLLSYIDVFWVLFIVCVLAVPAAFLLRPIERGKTLGPA